MVEQRIVEHWIQKHIISVLMHQKFARFRDMRPPKADTNLYSYHLKLLLGRGFVDKSDQGYSLGIDGLKYVDRLGANTGNLSVQPKIITMLVIQNEYGGTLMYRKQRQPFIDLWTIPFGKVHNADISLHDAAQREVQEKIGSVRLELRHVGDCYIRVHHEKSPIISTLAHVFYATTDEDLANEHLEWIDPRKLTGLDTTPAIKDIVARTFFRDPYFFEEYTVEW